MLHRTIIIICIFKFIGFESFIHGQNLTTIDSLEFALEKSEPGSESLIIYNKLSAEYITNDPVKALEYAEKAFDLANELNKDAEKLNAALRLAEVYSVLLNFKKANDFSLIAEELAIRDGDMIKQGHVKIILANIHLALFDLEKSMELFYESLHIFEELDLQHGISTALNGIGIIYHEQGNFDKALETFMKCYEINNTIGNHTANASILNNIASAYNGNKQYEKSIRYYLEALEVNKEIKNKYLECAGYLNLGDSYLNMGAQQEAIKYYYKSIELANELEDFESLTNCKISLAEYYFDKNEMDSTISFALDALALAEKYHFKQYVVDAANILHKAYRRYGDLENAYKYSILQSDKKDSLKIEQSIQKIANLDLKYRIEKEEQQRQMELQKEKSQQIILGILLLSLFIIIVIVLIARHRITVKNMKLEKNKVDSQLEMRNKELALNVMTLLKKNDMLTSISKELYEVKSNAVKSETKDAINKISRKIKKSSESEIWKEFELRFKEVHSEFYEILAQKFPDLTPGDQRLCALLKLNMSSKEIAELTGQSLKTLEKARYRLRKKLNLTDQSVNLINYLSGL